MKGSQTSKDNTAYSPDLAKIFSQYDLQGF